ncbi:carbohydrate ABC transporter permease [Sanguibacter suaedae]|uniref:Sugar ABC transporter permease n=1 Tax=Sanguibacter suaedae TaxID=2795737 RepID=A0A934M653_9MICO|nr:sugar ABC transporter permease [Sanguibacter suaedae]MBI9113862.1 sugar ABC transporter permease [Sanguibacter suaedae]
MTSPTKPQHAAPGAPAPEATQPPRRTARRSRYTRQDWAGAGFVAPFLAVFVFSIVAPLLYALYLSFFQDRLIGGSFFTGLANYTKALADPLLHAGLGRVLLFLAVQVPIMIGIALFAALAIDSGRLRGSGGFRIALFLPYAVPSVVAALMWGYIYGEDFGLVGQVFDLFGATPPALLSGTWMLASIGNIVTWSFMGYNMLILYSALRVIPTELYEAAEIDGAGALRTAWSIKLPALRPALLLTVIFSIIGSFQLFNEPNVLRSLAPTTITTYYTPNMYAYNLAFNGQQYNYSAAVAVIVGLITVLVAYAAQRVSNRAETGRKSK